ncbi:MAG TPA: hypothetical protein VK176_07050 [Phycisphaerales bacterium]|nr:hypothetical protein [Phycisphaerales bacterium]
MNRSMHLYRLGATAMSSHAPRCAAALTALLAASAHAQNLLGDDSFEYYGQIGSPWVNLPGTSPTLHQNRFIHNTPRCKNVLGLDIDPTTAALDGVRQTRFQPSLATGLFLGYVDFAGDRSRAVAPWTSQLRMAVSSSSMSIAHSLTAPVPLLQPMINTLVQFSSFYSRAKIFAIPLPQSQNFQFEIRDDDDRGVLVDNVHFFPLHIIDCNQGQPLGLAGYSVESDYSVPTTSTFPISDLMFGTSSASSCFALPMCDWTPDNKAVWVWSNECDCKTQMIIAGWSQAAVPINLKLHMEIEGLAGQGLPGFTVQFYDWVAQRWVAPADPLNLGKAFPGGKVILGPSCYSIDFTGYNGMPPLSAYTAGASFSGLRLVMARITFGTCGDWPSSCLYRYPPPPCSSFLIKVHHANIECN